MIEPHFDEETRGRMVWQLDYLLALTWTAHQGRHVSPWDDHIATEVHLFPAAHEILSFWIPDCEAMTDLSEAEAQAVRERFTGEVYDEPAVWRWPWLAALTPDEQAIVRETFLTHYKNDAECVVDAPYLAFDVESIVEIFDWDAPALLTWTQAVAAAVQAVEKLDFHPADVATGGVQ